VSAVLTSRLEELPRGLDCMEIRMDIIEHQLGGVAMLHLSGPLDSRGCQALAVKAVLALDDGPYALLLDVDSLGYLTSEGFRTLLYVRQQAAERQVKLALCGLAGSALEVFKISGLMGCFTLYADSETALAAFQSDSGIGQFRPAPKSSHLSR
jgi:anti-sigma B factor antagonist